MKGEGPATDIDGESTLLRPNENALPAILKDSEFVSGTGGVDKV